MTDALDHRLNAFRPDLADARLKGRVEADRFVEGMPARVSAPVTPLKRFPRPDAMAETEALFGEDILVFETTPEGWAWVQLEDDSYVGWMSSDALGERDAAPTHRIIAPRTLVFPGPDIKLPPLFALPMGARVTVAAEAVDHNARYGLIRPAGAIVTQHLGAPNEAADDFVSVAERFLGAPYLWGGKTFMGIDCSGLVQVACRMAGITAPRDTDMQERSLGTRLAGVEGLERGDLVFWKGHVGIMVDGANLLHANAHHMMTAIEPLAETLARTEEKGLPVTSVRRMAR
ncbi:NlpC/P60 family protein [Consotaella salsifontis]|uniref:NlpC/P60 family protein n=1 Tax=Consotaella salsifontis TaxID=1365950 RepID=A0A1T4S0E3_9HYPH|nr:NlpC/P60 family protein [Consotaella salsifontis]SKA21647.1 NlpC/P60 family protein [Consotaella salsifontis]